MKKLLTVLLLVVFVVGCSSKEDNPTQIKHGDSFVFSAKIKEISANNMLVTPIFGSGFSEVMVNVDTSKETPTYVFDPDDNTVKLFPKGLEKDDKVIIFYNGMATNSIPPQIPSYSVWVLDDDAPTDFRTWDLFIND